MCLSVYRARFKRSFKLLADFKAALRSDQSVRAACDRCGDGYSSRKFGNESRMSTWETVVTAKSSGYEDLEGPEQEFVEMAIYQTTYGNLKNKDKMTFKRTVEGKRVHGVIRTIGKAGHYKRRSGIRRSADIEHERDDGELVSEEEQQ